VKNIILFLFVFAISFIILQCNDQIISPENSNNRPLTSLEKKIVSSSEEFGFKLFNKVNELEPSKNLFISPLSVSYALAMTLNGANGNTYNAIRNTLCLQDISNNEINQSYKSLMELLVSIDSKIFFTIANSIWYQNSMTFEEQFINTNKEYFNAQVTSLDFNDPLSSSIINHWVEEKTNGKIKEIVDSPIPSGAVMFLINAIYFKGIWKFQFDPNYTKDDHFYSEDGSIKNCRMMNQKVSIPYYSNDLFQAIDLPYGDGKFSMTVLLPNPNKSVNDAINRLTPDNWQDLLHSFSEKEVGLLMPKFILEYNLKMNDALMQLGMAAAFSDQADFTSMYKPGGLFISSVKHKTFVKVDEEGTEAAAVTSVQIDRTAYGDKEIIMQVNRPFIFIIREINSDAILFIGKITEPKVE
jgi:serine protease inhibitor